MPFQGKPELHAATIGAGLELKASTIDGAGAGLFATQRFGSGAKITMYDGRGLPEGFREACALDVQTHVGTKDGIYVDGYDAHATHRGLAPCI